MKPFRRSCIPCDASKQDFSIPSPRPKRAKQAGGSFFPFETNYGIIFH